MTAEHFLQGPLSDAMTHAGQLASSKALGRSPVAPENFIVADITPDRRVDQALPVSPDAVWHEGATRLVAAPPVVVIETSAERRGTHGTRIRDGPSRGFQRGMCVRKYRAHIHRSVTVSHATIDAFKPNMFVPPGTADGTMSLELFTAACISMTSRKLPLVCA